MYLIADSGSTKTLWLLCESRTIVKEISTPGINPFYTDENSIVSLLCAGLLPQLGGIPAEAVHFYGAGCIPGEKSDMVRKALQSVFPSARTEVLSDLWAACRGLCGQMPGIVCILGTGSNSCLYDGTDIVKNVPPLGFILGDEGSGAVLGRTLLADYLKGLMPSGLARQFSDRYDVSGSQVLDKIYKQPFPNRYAASFVPFIAANLEHPYMSALVEKEFSRFVSRNLEQYGNSFTLNFTGSVAWFFKAAIEKVCRDAGFNIGKIVKEPAHGLVAYHGGRD